AESTNDIHTKTNALVQNSVLNASGNVSITADASSADVGRTLTPSGGIAAFTTGLDDAATTDLLDADRTISGTVYKEGTPDPTDVPADNTFKTTLRGQLASAGFTLSSDPNDLAVTIRKYDTKDTSDTADDTGVELSVTDRKSGITLVLVKDSLGNF